MSSCLCVCLCVSVCAGGGCAGGGGCACGQVQLLRDAQGPASFRARPGAFACDALYEKGGATHSRPYRSLVRRKAKVCGDRPLHQTHQNWPRWRLGAQIHLTSAFVHDRWAIRIWDGAEAHAERLVWRERLPRVVDKWWDGHKLGTGLRVRYKLYHNFTPALSQAVSGRMNLMESSPLAGWYSPRGGVMCWLTFLSR